MRIIPAIDIIDGKCVRLTKGDYATKKIYNEDPLEAALVFEAAGIEYLHLVDLDGAKAAHIVNYRVLEKLASKTRLKIDFGGGLKSDDDLRIAFNSGASQVTGGSIAVKNPELFLRWLKAYGADRIILGADAINERISVSGWQESSEKELIPFIQNYLESGIHYVICTDIAKDGMLSGPSTELYRKIIAECSSSNANEAPLKLIASGGITTMDDIEILKEIGCEGAIIGKAIYEQTIQIKDLEDFILQRS